VSDTLLDLNYMIHRVSVGAILGLAYLLVEGVCQLAITPILLHTYPSAEVGLWVLITNFLVLIQVGQGGLGPITTRALAKALAKDEVAWRLERGVAKRAYGAAAAILVVILLGVGAYIGNVAHRTGIPSWGMFWWPFAAGLLLRMYAWQWISALSSLGYVGYDKGLAVGNSLLCYGGYLGVAVCHLPIASIGMIYGGFGLVYALSAFLLLRRVSRAQHRLNAAQHRIGILDASAVAPSSLRDYVRESSQFVVMNISGFLVLNLDVVLVERLFGAQVVAYFGIIVKLGFLVLSLATLIPGLYYPFIARKWAEGDIAAVHDLYRRGLLISMGVAVLADVALLIIAPTVVRQWFGPAAYLGSDVLAAQMLFVLISVHTVAQATPAIATGEVRFGDLAILNAVCAVAGSLLIGWRLGPLGVALGNAVGTLVPSVLHGLRAQRVFSPGRWQLLRATGSEGVRGSGR
jgi:O-antigen/teichoic acid export membrane protein